MLGEVCVETNDLRKTEFCSFLATYCKAFETSDPILGVFPRSVSLVRIPTASSF